jgi:hypothetical protein
LPAKLTTTIQNIDVKIANQVNRQLINEFYEYLKNIDTSENYQNGLLKVLVRYAEYVGEKTTFYQIQEKEQILEFLDSKRKIEKEMTLQAKLKITSVKSFSDNPGCKHQSLNDAFIIKVQRI